MKENNLRVPQPAHLKNAARIVEGTTGLAPRALRTRATLRLAHPCLRHRPPRAPTNGDSRPPSPCRAIQTRVVSRFEREHLQEMLPHPRENISQGRKHG